MKSQRNNHSVVYGVVPVDVVVDVAFNTLVVLKSNPVTSVLNIPPEIVGVRSRSVRKEVTVESPTVASVTTRITSNSKTV